MPIRTATKIQTFPKGLASNRGKLAFRRWALKAPVVMLRVHTADGAATTVYIVRHKRERVRPRLVVFDEPTVLLDWCLENRIENGISGGYDLHHEGPLLGDYWQAGQRLASEPMAAPWHKLRGALAIDSAGTLTIGPRHTLPSKPDGDLMQVGPLLVENGESLIVEGISPEGFSETAHQFTPDPSIGRHPRVAIGYDDNHIWTVVTDGRDARDSGLTFAEVAELMLEIGAKTALNLDGGISAQLVRRGQLLNKPKGQFGDIYPEGYPIRTALVFEPR